MTEIEWEGDPSLRWDGYHLGGATSNEDGHKDRWTEITVHLTDGGTYLVVVVGRSVVEGEQDRHSLTVHRRAEDAVRSLTRRGDRGLYLPRVAQAACEDASGHAQGAALEAALTDALAGMRWNQ